jgi:hypothetical protein
VQVFLSGGFLAALQETIKAGPFKDEQKNFIVVNGPASVYSFFANWGRCYDPNFLRFSPISGEKIGVFS